MIMYDPQPWCRIWKYILWTNITESNSFVHGISGSKFDNVIYEHNLQTMFTNTSCEIAFTWMSLHICDDKLLRRNIRYKLTQNFIQTLIFHHLAKNVYSKVLALPMKQVIFLLMGWHENAHRTCGHGARPSWSFVKWITNSQRFPASSFIDYHEVHWLNFCRPIVRLHA